LRLSARRITIPRLPKPGLATVTAVSGETVPERALQPGHVATGLRVLGPVELVADGSLVPIGHVKQRSVLAALVIEANRVVPTEQLIDHVWADEPPRRVRNVLSGYAARLRAAVTTHLADHGAQLLWRSGGYSLEIDPELIDLWRFRRLVDRARAAGDGERFALFGEALALWRGQALGGTDGAWALGMRATLEEEQVTAEIAYAQESLRLGSHELLLERLCGLSSRHPLNEAIAGQLMLALHRSGRDGDALRVHARIRARLRDDLGTDPGPALAEIHRRILTVDRSVGLPSSPAVVPRQLPPCTPDFVGREDVLRQLDDCLPVRPATAAPLALIVGPPGIGKTALATWWAQRAAPHFPDGQLFVDLRGFNAHQPPVSAHEALARLLGALGIEPGALPPGLDERSALYRSLLAGKRVLVLLDDAHDAEQVRPLLPGAATCALVVTSRNRLGSLVTRNGARLLNLDPLTPADSTALMRRVLGRQRCDAEAAAVAELGQLCGYLPLALRIAADDLAFRPGTAVAQLSARLTDERTRLDVLSADDETGTVRAAFSHSYEQLDPGARRAFRLLGLTQGSSVALPAAAALINAGLDETRRLLDTLCRRHLVEPAELGRYRLHDLLRVYALERAEATESTAERHEAVRRMVHWYLGTAVAADLVIAPQRYREPLSAATALPSMSFGSLREALRWCDEENVNLLAAIRQAYAEGLPDLCWQLAFALREHFVLRKQWPGWLASYELGLAAARQVGNLAAQAAMLHGLGAAHYYPRRLTQAISYYRQSYAIWRDLADRWGQGIALNGLGNVLMELRRLPLAVAFYRRALIRLYVSQALSDQGVVLNNLAEAHCLLGQHRDALSYARRSIEIDRRTGNRRVEVFALCHAADALGALGRPAEARSLLDAALVLAAEIGDRHGTAWVLQYLGEWFLRTGRPDCAREEWQRAITLFDGLGDPQAGDLRARAAEL
jgi:DNA-binding SARP family transcriptional activator/tetratricopeptide (TPR) repeat protein